VKIALTGSGGTGKTVTALEIARLMKWEHINSQARYVFEAMGGESMETNPVQDPERFMAIQEAIIDRQIAYEKDVSAKTPNWIAERTVLDTAAYVAFWSAAMPVATTGRWRKAHESIKDRATRIINKAQQHAVSGAYDHVFIMPYGRVPLRGDVFRSGDAMYQRVIDIMMTGLVMKKLADRTTQVPILEAGETDTALWIIRQLSLKPVLKPEEWYKGITAAAAAQTEEALNVCCQICSLANIKHHNKNGKCSSCGRSV
jgi:cytidylate kinase